jgi:teichoic acid transport system permease protein
MSIAEHAERSGLRKVGGRPPFFHYLRDVWRRRTFIYRLARYRIESENSQHRLGMWWVVLKPTIDAIIYGTVFGYFLLRGNIPNNYILFLIIGIFMFEFFSGSFTSGAKSITRNANLVQSLSFPRMALPLALVIQQLLEFLPMMLIVFGALAVYGIRPEAEWLLIVPVLALFTIFNAGVTMFTARLTVHFRDLTQLLPFVSRVLFYTTGVFFSIELMLEGRPAWMLRIFDFHPIHEFLSLGRDALVDGVGFEANPDYWLYASVWSLVVIVAGSLFFWAAEERYGRVD